MATFLAYISLWWKISPGWGCTPTPFHYFYHHGPSCGVRSSWQGRYTHPFSTLTLYVLCGCKSEVDADVAMLMPQQQGLYHSSKGSSAARVPQQQGWYHNSKAGTTAARLVPQQQGFYSSKGSTVARLVPQQQGWYHSSKAGTTAARLLPQQQGCYHSSKAAIK